MQRVERLRLASRAGVQELGGALTRAISPTIVRTMVNDPFAALSNPTRRAIIERLAAGPSTVGEAASGLALSKPAISRHVKYLEDAGVVRRSVQGRTHLLVLNVAVLNQAADWLDRQRLVWDRMFDAVEVQLSAGLAGSDDRPPVSEDPAGGHG